MDINYLDKYIRKPTESELHPNRPLSFSQNWDVWKRISTTSGVLVIKQDRYNDVFQHEHPWFELIYIYDGTASVTVEGKEILLKKNQCLLINKEVSHSCSACGEQDILLNFLITKEYLNQNFFNRFSEESYLSRYFVYAMNDQTQAEHSVFFPSEGSRRLPIFVREFLCEYYDKGIYSTDYMDSLMTLILLELANVYRHNFDQKTPQNNGDNIMMLLRYIEENYLTCTLKSMADFFHMNSNYLSNYIKKQTGLTFTQLIQEQKLMYAASLLRNTDIPVTDVANLAGYENVSFFYKKFEEKYHFSPKEYRIYRQKQL